MRRDTSGRTGTAILVLGSVWLVSGAGCREPAREAPLRIAHESDLQALDPIVVSEAATASILSNVYEGLTAFDRNMALVPALAIGWNTPDETTWVIRLRPGTRLHDGSVLLAEDVKAALLRARYDEASGARGRLFSLAGIDVIDAGTLRLTTSTPDSLLMTRLADVLISPRPASAGAPPPGTGPYRFVRWKKGESLEVEAFPDYWGGVPPVRRVLFVPIEEGAAAVAALRARRVDLLRFLPDDLADELGDAPWVRVAARTGLVSNYLWLDGLRSEKGGPNPIADRRVRQAISLGIDRRELVRAIHGHGTPAAQFVPREIFGHVASLPPLRFDPDEARRLLASAGYPAGFSTTLAYSRGSSSEITARLVSAMLGRLGIRLALEAPAWGEMVSAWRAGRLPFFLSGWRFDNGDATSFLRDCLVTRDQKRGAGSYNPGFSSPDLDRLVEEQERVFPSDEKLRHYERVMRLLLEEMPVIPLYHRVNLFGVAERLRWEPRLDGKILAAEVRLRE